MAMLTIGTALTAAVAFAIRALAGGQGRFRGVDTWFHLHIADCVRAQGRRFRSADCFVPSGIYDYPPALGWVLSRLPREAAARWQWLLSPVAEAGHTALTCALAYYLWRDPLSAAMAGLIYAVTPVSVGISCELTPRALGALLLSVAVGASVVAAQAANAYSVPLFAGSVAAVGLLLMTHRMSTQALLPIAVGVAAFTGHVAVLAAVAAAVAATVVLTRGHYITVLRGHLIELRFWFRNVHRLDEARPLKLLADHGQAAADERRSLRSRAATVYRLVRHLPFILVFVGASWGLWTAAPLSRPFVAWGAIAYVAFVATTYVRPLRFLGEGYRYLTYAALPIAVTAGGALVPLSRGWPSLYIAAGLALAISLRELRGRYAWAQHQAKETVNPSLMSILDFLRQRNEDGVVCVPVGLANSVAYFAKKRTLRHGASAALSELEFFYPLVQEPLEAVVQRFHANWLLVDVRKLPSGFDLACGELCRECLPYRLYRVVANTANAVAAT
ncbi:MAG: hypothetical protein JSV65_12195 [Armatimonadota bacterium]|nr:MAG: hypothetical protein JSV65_12195 [Armatimonadota bacterium]